MSEGYDAEAEARAFEAEGQALGLYGMQEREAALARLIRRHRAAGRREGIARLDAVRALVERWRAMSANRYAWGRAADELETALGEP